MPRSFLTIDDSPGDRMDDLVDWLYAQGVPAMFFCRGDLLEAKPAPVIRAIKKGFGIASHGYTHTRASRLTLGEVKTSILEAQRVIDAAYAAAGQARAAKHIRFPYMDRGMGAWFVEPDTVPETSRAYVAQALIASGLGHSPDALPTPEGVARKNDIAQFLQAQGFTAPDFGQITHEFYAASEMARAIDAQFTFSNADWAVTQRHKGNYGYNTVDDLNARFDAHRHLFENGSDNIILAHDQGDIHDVTIACVAHMLARGVQF